MRALSCYKNNRCGQALVELAVFGAIILSLFAWMLGFGQNMTASQALTMRSFRQAERLAQKRSKDSKLGSVSFTTIAPVNPVNPMNTKVSSSDASGSASVLWENELFSFATPEAPEDVDKDDSPITYYQIGDTMIKNNQAVEWPTMVVKRKVEKKYRTYKDWFFNAFAWAVKAINDIQSGDIFLDTQKYYSIEAQPVWDTVRKINDVYVTNQDTTQTGKTAKLREKSTTDLTTTTTYKLLSEGTIKDWDDNILDIVSMEKTGDLDIVQKQKLEAEKKWENSVQ